MMYVPNRTKMCKFCGKTILYNEEYLGIDTLDASNNVRTEIRHASCSPYSGSMGLSGMAVSGVGSIPSQQINDLLRAYQQHHQRYSQIRQAQAQQASLMYGGSYPKTSPSATEAKSRDRSAYRKFQEIVERYKKALSNGGTDGKKDS